MTLYDTISSIDYDLIYTLHSTIHLLINTYEMQLTILRENILELFRINKKDLEKLLQKQKSGDQNSGDRVNSRETKFPGPNFRIRNFS